MKCLIRLRSGFCGVVMAGGLALALAGVAAAAPAGSLKIAVVNYSQLIQNSPQAQSAVASLRAEFAPKQRNLQTQANALKAREDTLKKNEATMTQDQRDQAEVELRQQYQDLAREQSEIQDDVNTRRNELMSELQHQLQQIVQAYAKQQGYDLVLADGFIYANTALDITPAILSALKSQAGARHAPAARGK